MDLFDSISGQTAVSRRALLQGGLIAGITGLAGCMATQFGGEQALSAGKDETSEDDELSAGKQAADGSDTDSDDGGGGTKTVISQVDLSERDGRVTIRLGVYERVVLDRNLADGDSTGESAWRIDGKRAALKGVSFRAREDDTLQLTLQNPTPVPYTFSVTTSDNGGRVVSADSYGVTVAAGAVETAVIDWLDRGTYAYSVLPAATDPPGLFGQFDIRH